MLLLPVCRVDLRRALSCFVLIGRRRTVSIVVVAVGVSFIFGMLGIVIEYARRRRFLRQLERAAEELESPAWVQEMVQCPTYAEGELEYEVLRRVGKAACDEVAEGRRPGPMTIATISRAGSTRPSCPWRRLT